MSGIIKSFVSGFKAAREEKAIVSYKLKFDNPHSESQMLITASFYALGIISSTQFRSLLQGDTVEFELKGSVKDHALEPAFIMEDNEHILRERDATKLQKKQYAENRILCTTATVPEKIDDDKVLKRYDKFYKYGPLFQQLCDETKRSHREELISDAMDALYPVYKDFSKSKPPKQQPKQHSGEPELKKFKENGYRKVADMLSVTLEEIQGMKPKERTKFLEDMQTAAENFTIRSSYLSDKLADMAVQGTKDNEIWDALIWHFEKVDAKRAAEIKEVRDDNVDVAIAAKLCGISDTSAIVADYRSWKNNNKNKNKKGKGKGNKQQQSATAPLDFNAAEQSFNFKPYEGKKVSGFFADVIIHEWLETLPTGIADKVSTELQKRIPDPGTSNSDCDAQVLYDILSAFETLGLLEYGTTKQLMSKIVSGVF